MSVSIDGSIRFYMKLDVCYFKACYFVQISWIDSNLLRQDNVKTAHGLNNNIQTFIIYSKLMPWMPLTLDSIENTEVWNMIDNLIVTQFSIFLIILFTFFNFIYSDGIKLRWPQYNHDVKTDLSFI